MKQIIATAIVLCLFAAAPVYGQHMEITPNGSRAPRQSAG
jgi:hypothetical protein